LAIGHSSQCSGTIPKSPAQAFRIEPNQEGEISEPGRCGQGERRIIHSTAQGRFIGAAANGKNSTPQCF
jgi:hypothetical protein